MHELDANVAAINLPRFVGHFACQAFEIGVLQRSKNTERIESRFVIAPAPEGIKHAFAILNRRSLGRGGRLLGGLGSLRELFFFQGGAVGHGVCLVNPHFATECALQLPRPICPFLEAFAVKMAL